MNKKGDLEISLKQIIGFILVAIIMTAFVGFAVKVWGIFTNKPAQATMNSFSNLLYEIDNLPPGESLEVPYYIQDDYYLRTECRLDKDDTEFADDICICKGHDGNDCYGKSRVEREFTEDQRKVKIMGTEAIGNQPKVINVKLIRSTSGDTVCVYDDITKNICPD